MSELSDGELLTQLTALAKKEQELIAAVLVHLAEVERRGLHLAKGCSSLFAYCVERLGFSEDVAYKRVGAARYGRRFPLALDLVAKGSLHLSALMLIGPHLTEANHRDWLMAAAGKSRREVERLIATRCPKPDVRSSLRKLPNRQDQTNAEGMETATVCSQQAHAYSSNSEDAVGAVQSNSVDGGVQPSSVDNGVQPSSVDGGVQPSSVGGGVQPNSVDGGVQPSSVDGGVEQRNAAAGTIQSSGSGVTAVGSDQPSATSTRAADRPRVQPLSASSYRVVFTASETLKQKLDRARELCSHSVAPTDLPALIERALELLIDREEKRRFAVRSPRTASTMQEPDLVAPIVPSKRPTDAGAPSSRTKQEPDPVAPIVPSKRPTDASAPSSRTKQEPDLVAPIVPSKHPTNSGARSSRTNQEPDRPDLVEPVVPSKCPVEQRPPSAESSPERNLIRVVSGCEFRRRAPAAVRRAVWKRDSGQCSFIDDEGHRCAERRFLEIDHVVAFAQGGPSTVDNCRLLCRLCRARHNRHYAAYRIMPRRLWSIAFQPSEFACIDGGALAVGGIIRALQGMPGGRPSAGNVADRRGVVQFEPVRAPSSPDRHQDTFA